MKIEDLLPAHRHESCTPERLRKRLLALAADIREKGVRFHNGRLSMFSPSKANRKSSLVKPAPPGSTVTHVSQ